MTNPNHTDTSRSGDLVERLRGDWPEILVEKHWMMDSDAIDKQRAEAADRIEALEAENERLREALERIGIYGCGMLSQPAAMNGPEETWLKQRIFEMERTARAALAGDSHD